MKIINRCFINMTHRNSVDNCHLFFVQKFNVKHGILKVTLTWLSPRYTGVKVRHYLLFMYIPSKIREVVLEIKSTSINSIFQLFSIKTQMNK